MSLSAVPKPANAGNGFTTSITTRASYVNLRTGPGTNYLDIGDVPNGTTVVYYPPTKTASGWAWIEYRGIGGWVYTEVVTFNDVSETITPPTPYRGQAALWHWKGQVIPENTIEQFATNVRRIAPNVKQILVKVGDGNAWQGRFDTKPDLAINGPADVARWVQVLQRYGMEFHAWIVLKGVDIVGEATIIGETCTQPGVRSMILDVEPYAGYWEVGPEPIRPLMTNVRSRIGSNFHIGMAVDPRRAHYDSIFPGEWFPFINSVHTMNYWDTFQRPVENVLAETYSVWGDYGRPLIPILQGTASISEQRDALELATDRYGAEAVSWWRYGIIDQFSVVNTPIEIDSSPTIPGEDDEPVPGTEFGHQKTILVGEPDFRSGTYTGQQEFRSAQGTFGWTYYYKPVRERSSYVWAEWKTELPESGNYQIAVFIPANHSSTTRARYKIHGIRGTTTEVVVDINQSRYSDEWVPLGMFDLVRGAPNAGKVFLNDVTGEADTGREIAFDAVRFRQIIVVDDDPGDDVVDGVYVADGYDSPVGTLSERNAATVWPLGWRDASPYAEIYFAGTPRQAYHTGADLNVGAAGNADIGVPVYAPASGVVIYQRNLNPWGNVTIIKHDPLRVPGGAVYYTRYGHMQGLRVNEGQRVARGQQIGEIGTGGGRYIAHLHFDVVRTTVLENRPGDWPGMDLTRLLRDYVDPRAFIRANRP